MPVDGWTTRRSIPWRTRFWARVQKTDGCWLWTGAVNQGGYGVFGHRGGECYMAHRLMWSLTCGPIPDGLFVCHTCDNPPCVRPDHLFLGTAKDNHQDMLNKGRGNFHVTHAGSAGERNHRAKLTDSQAVQIRALSMSGAKRSYLIETFAVSHSIIDHIASGLTYKSQKCLPIEIAAEDARLLSDGIIPETVRQQACEHMRQRANP